MSNLKAMQYAVDMASVLMNFYLFHSLYAKALAWALSVHPFVHSGFVHLDCAKPAVKVCCLFTSE